MRSGLWPIAVLMSTFVACANDTNVVKVPANEKQFSVTLQANPTTGYQWTVKQMDSKLLQIASTQYIADAKGKIGSGGKMMFVFFILPNAKLPASTNIDFLYARPWEQNLGTTQSVTVNFLGAKK